MKGTPRTLREAIENGPANDGRIVEANIRDYLAQEFQRMYLEVEMDRYPGQYEALEELAVRLGVVKR